MASNGNELNNFETELLNIIEEIDANIEKNRNINENVLIDDLSVKTNRLIEEKSFRRIERVFHFSINSDQSYDTSKPLPKLKLPERLTKLNVNLEQGFDECLLNNGLIDDYSYYRDLKLNYFLKAIKDNDLIGRYSPQNGLIWRSGRRHSDRR